MLGRYQIQDVLGVGAHETVVSVIDKVTVEKLAIKNIEKAFDNPFFTKRTLRELKIMRLMKHDDVLSANSI